MKSIRQGHWCPRCAYDANRARYRAGGMLRLKMIVKSRNGVLHSTEYRGKEVKYAFECDKGHFWHTGGIGGVQGRHALTQPASPVSARRRGPVT